MEAGELSFSSPYSSDWGGGAVSVSPQVCQVYSVRKDEHLHKTLRQTRPKAPGGGSRSATCRGAHGAGL